MFKQIIIALGALVAATGFAAVDVNKASLAELESIKGIGPTTSAQILGERYGFIITPANQGGTDHAQGGARIALLPGYPNEPPTGTALPVTAQVTQQIGKGIDPNAVHALWAGGNDVIHQLGLAQAGVITAAEAQAAVALAATQYVLQVAALQAAGAKNVVVFNLPDLDTPVTYYENYNYSSDNASFAKTLYRQSPRALRAGLKYTY